MISLRQLFASLPVQGIKGIHEGHQPVHGLTSDSRKVKPGFVFVALKGEKVDGHRFVQDAFKGGCLAAVVQDEAGLPEKLPLIKVADSHRAYGMLAAQYFGHPAENMKLVGLTGTNGKTTTSWMIEQVVKSGGGRPGIIGTVNYRYQEKGGRIVEHDAPLTTPEPMNLQGLLREMSDAGVTHVILEVSSHSLTQRRLAGLLFDVAVFTNLSRDHLDYHASMEEYFDAKKKLFDEYLQPSGIAVVALEPLRKSKKAGKDWGKKLVGHLSKNGFVNYSGKGKRPSCITCGFDNVCTVHAENESQDIEGFKSTIRYGSKKIQVRSELIGRHNISNMLVATGVGCALRVNFKNISKGLHDVHTVPGRLERVAMATFDETVGSPSVFVDYAHTPDALENVLNTLRSVTPGRLFCIFGCGGDRDKGKRPMMGAVAGTIADAVLVTSDNPRSENPLVIISAIEKGLAETGLHKVSLDVFFSQKKAGKGYAVLENRREAIHQVCSQAGNKDVVLIAGKGHETYQVTAAGKHFFDDRIEARNGSLRWTVDHLLSATSGKLKCRGKEKLFGRISTDTRSLEPGDVFVALEGENFDGHDYVQAAVKKGAAAVIVHKKCKSLGKKVSVLHVEDTLQGLGDIAQYRRSLLGSAVKVIGITGSSGKTTVKEMVASIFETEFAGNPGYPVLKTQGNLNNLIGLPLSLLNLDAAHKVAVMEMGMNSPGEIERLTTIADPDIGCITNVQAAHLEGLGSIEGVARAKGELFSAMSGQGIKIVNYDDPYIRKLGGTHGDNVIAYAVTPVGRRFNPDVRATRIVSLGEAGMRFTLHINTWRKRITIPATGIHNVANCTAAAAIATAARIAPGVIAQGLVKYRHGDKRLQIVDLQGGVHLVNDSYNANPASMAAALKTVVGFGKECRRVALLGDMFELGHSAVEAHKGVGKLVAELGFDYLGVTGDHAEVVADSARQTGMSRAQIMECRDKETMVNWVAGLIARNKIGDGDWLLLKGSRGMRMEQVLHSLRQKLTPDKS